MTVTESTLAEIETLFHDSYRPAVAAHLEYEVFANVRNKKAVTIGKRLDKSIPFCPFGDRLFAVILSVVMLFVGYLLGLFT